MERISRIDFLKERLALVQSDYQRFLRVKDSELDRASKGVRDCMKLCQEEVTLARVAEMPREEDPDMEMEMKALDDERKKAGELERNMDREEQKLRLSFLNPNMEDDFREAMGWVRETRAAKWGCRRELIAVQVKSFEQRLNNEFLKEKLSEIKRMNASYAAYDKDYKKLVQFRNQLEKLQQEGKRESDHYFYKTNRILGKVKRLEQTRDTVSPDEEETEDPTRPRILRRGNRGGRKRRFSPGPNDKLVTGPGGTAYALPSYPPLQWDAELRTSINGSVGVALDSRNRGSSGGAFGRRRRAAETITRAVDERDIIEIKVEPEEVVEWGPGEPEEEEEEEEEVTLRPEDMMTVEIKEEELARQWMTVEIKEEELDPLALTGEETSVLETVVEVEADPRS